MTTVYKLSDPFYFDNNFIAVFHINGRISECSNPMGSSGHDDVTRQQRKMSGKKLIRSGTLNTIRPVLLSCISCPFSRH